MPGQRAPQRRFLAAVAPDGDPSRIRPSGNINNLGWQTGLTPLTDGKGIYPTLANRLPHALTI